MGPILHRSRVFDTTVLIWKIFGLWSSKSSNKYFRVYSCIFVALTSILYVFFFTLNLIFTPRTVEIFATQAIFYFTALSVIIKMIVIMISRDKIILNFELMDCKEFRSSNSKNDEYQRQFESNYAWYFKFYAVGCILNASTFLYVLPLISYFLVHQKLTLPMCEYYFLSDEIRNKYFSFWYVFQTAGLSSTLASHITSHTFICGLISVAITQFKMLNWNIANISLDDSVITDNEREREYSNLLNDCLKHYELILKFCQNVQDIINILIFVQLGLAALSICFCMYMLVLPEKDLMFMGSFTTIILLDNFLPSFLGSELTYESKNLQFAAYSCDWVSRSKSLKTMLIILMERAQRPVYITGLQMVPLSLHTFVAIVKTAYSFFTLLRGTQNH